MSVYAEEQARGKYFFTFLLVQYLIGISRLYRKSSLVVVLTRLYLAKSLGSIYLDGVDITSCGLKVLRRSISIIPQSPLIMPGSIRFNLDPFTSSDDSVLYDVLRKVNLSISLHDDADQLSLGERQLLSIARILLRTPEQRRIVLLDEPTASIDPTTDAKIQAVMRTELKESTTITIAHRINTIISCDKILVMSNGRVAEFGPPGKLLENNNGIFSEMVRESQASS